MDINQENPPPTEENPDQQPEASQGQVSEVSSMRRAGEEIDPSDAVAGAPEHSAGDDRAQEGTAGPDAPPRHGIPENSNESSR